MSNFAQSFYLVTDQYFFFALAVSYNLYLYDFKTPAFGTIRYWMGATHFQMKTLKRVSMEMNLHVLAYNMKRVIKIPGAGS